MQLFFGVFFNLTCTCIYIYLRKKLLNLIKNKLDESFLSCNQSSFFFFFAIEKENWDIRLTWDNTERANYLLIRKQEYKDDILVTRVYRLVRKHLLGNLMCIDYMSVFGIKNYV